MAKRILDVGQCDPDHSGIVRYMSQHFSAEVDRAKLVDQAFQMLRDNEYDLVLVNRRFDEDDSDGLEFIRSLKADTMLGKVPVMLVTNYPEYQQKAVDAGAVPGFGKAEYHKPETRERVAAVLEANTAS